MAVLSENEIEQHLKSLPDWELEGEAIAKTYEFSDFVTAIDFVTEVAEQAESLGHHPDIDVHYNEVTLTLSTHSEGGVTSKDIEAAGLFDEAAA